MCPGLLVSMASRAEVHSRIVAKHFDCNPAIRRDKDASDPLFFPFRAFTGKGATDLSSALISTDESATSSQGPSPSVVSRTMTGSSPPGSTKSAHQTGAGRWRRTGSSTAGACRTGTCAASTRASSIDMSSCRSSSGIGASSPMFTSIVISSLTRSCIWRIMGRFIVRLLFFFFWQLVGCWMECSCIWPGFELRF